MEICNDQMKCKGKQMFGCKEFAKNIVHKQKNDCFQKNKQQLSLEHCQGVSLIHALLTGGNGIVSWNT